MKGRYNLTISPELFEGVHYGERSEYVELCLKEHRAVTSQAQQIKEEQQRREIEQLRQVTSTARTLCCNKPLNELPEARLFFFRTPEKKVSERRKDFFAVAEYSFFCMDCYRQPLIDCCLKGEIAEIQQEIQEAKVLLDLIQREQTQEPRVKDFQESEELDWFGLKHQGPEILRDRIKWREAKLNAPLSSYLYDLEGTAKPQLLKEVFKENTSQNI